LAGAIMTKVDGIHNSTKGCFLFHFVDLTQAKVVLSLGT